MRLDKPNFNNPVFDGAKQPRPFSSAWQRWLAQLFDVVNSGAGAAKFAATGPPAAGMTWTVSHGLNTSDVLVQVKDLSSNILIPEQVQPISDNQVLITFNIPQGMNSVRVVVVG